MRVVDDPDIAGLSVGYRSILFHDGAGGAAVRVRPHRTATPTRRSSTVESRPRADEIALGGQTLDRLDASIGDRLEFRGPQGDVRRADGRRADAHPRCSSFVDDLSVGEGGLVDPALVERVRGQRAGPRAGGRTPRTRLPSAVASILEGLSGSGSSAATSTPPGPRSPPTCAATTRCGDTPLAPGRACCPCSGSACSPTPSPPRCAAGGSSWPCSGPSGSRGRDLRASVRWSVLTLVGACVAHRGADRRRGRPAALGRVRGRPSASTADPLTPVGRRSRSWCALARRSPALAVLGHPGSPGRPARAPPRCCGPSERSVGQRDLAGVEGGAPAARGRVLQALAMRSAHRR